MMVTNAVTIGRNLYTVIDRLKPARLEFLAKKFDLFLYGAIIIHTFFNAINGV